MQLNLPSVIQSFNHPVFDKKNIIVDIKRDDLIHSVISGNKWRKLKYLIQDAKSRNCKTLISMGGNYSNHLHALAYAGKALGLNTIGFVRAHAEQKLTPSLKDCQKWGMQLVFVNRLEYAKLRENHQWNTFNNQYPNSYWITEGGYSELAIRGVREISQEVSSYYDYIFCGVGSGTTLAGLAQAFPDSKVIGIAAFKGAEYLEQELQTWLKEATNWQLETQYHYGGFAKTNEALSELGKQFYQVNGFELDKVYNLKVLSAVIDYMDKEKILANNKVLLINTGGVQGNR